MNEQELYPEITRMVDWYNEKLYSSGNVSELLDFAGKLSGYAYYLSEIVSEFKKNYNSSRFTRRINLSRQTTEFMDKGDSATASKERAFESKEHEAQYKEEMEIEGAAYKAETMLKSIYTIIDVIRTRVSYLKQEQQQTKNET